jgi:hypothetical protein|nr:MAG TPA: hypothetical protein [Caudoviricetes sp.]
MVTLRRYGKYVNRKCLELYGKSTDEKPIDVFDGKVIGNASEFYEMDTKRIFFYSEDDKTWYEQ